jgi:hypothetical protein
MSHYHLIPYYWKMFFNSEKNMDIIKPKCNIYKICKWKLWNFWRIWILKISLGVHVDWVLVLKVAFNKCSLLCNPAAWFVLQAQISPDLNCLFFGFIHSLWFQVVHIILVIMYIFWCHPLRWISHSFPLPTYMKR